MHTPEAARHRTGDDAVVDSDPAVGPVEADATRQLWLWAPEAMPRSVLWRAPTIFALLIHQRREAAGLLELAHRAYRTQGIDQRRAVRESLANTDTALDELAAIVAALDAHLPTAAPGVVHDG